MSSEQPSFLSLIVGIIQGYLERVGMLAHLINLEAKLAFKTLIMLALLAGVVLIIGLSCWLSLLCLLALALVHLSFSWLEAVAIVSLSNIIFILAICMYMLKIKRHLFFPATRKQITTSLSFNEGIEHEQAPITNSTN